MNRCWPACLFLAAALGCRTVDGGLSGSEMQGDLREPPGPPPSADLQPDIRRDRHERRVDSGDAGPMADGGPLGGRMGRSIDRGLIPARPGGEELPRASSFGGVRILPDSQREMLTRNPFAPPTLADGTQLASIWPRQPRPGSGLRFAAVAAKLRNRSVVAWDVDTGRRVYVPRDLEDRLRQTLSAAGEEGRAFAVVLPDGNEEFLDGTMPIALVDRLMAAPKRPTEVDRLGPKMVIVAAGARDLQLVRNLVLKYWVFQGATLLATPPGAEQSDSDLSGGMLGGDWKTVEGSQAQVRFMPGGQDRVRVEVSGLPDSEPEGAPRLAFLDHDGRIIAGSASQATDNTDVLTITMQSWRKVKAVGLRKYESRRVEVGRMLLEPVEKAQ